MADKTHKRTSEPNDANPVAPLLQRMHQVYPLTDAARAALQQAMEVVTLEKKTVFLTPGKVCNYMYYVLKGLVRVYYFVGDEEITSRLMSEGYFITSFGSYFSRKPGTEYMEAYEDCVLMRIHVDAAQEIYKKHLEVNYAVRALTEYSFYLSEERTVALRGTSAASRVAFFLQRHPELVNRVANMHIASYLGIKRETYSREMRKQYEVYRKKRQAAKEEGDDATQ
jgi:CRP-like cAMP-binding protein